VSVSDSQIRAALDQVIDPAEGKSILAAGLLDGIAVEGDRVMVTLAVPAARAAQSEALRRRAEQALEGLPGVAAAQVMLTATKPDHGRRGPTRVEGLVPEVKQILVVASGKGGVGKSTIAFNLAVALARRGMSVGLLDADVHGPSLPILSGVTDRPRRDEAGRITPLSAHGLTMLSVGFMVDPAQAAVWRGPVAQGAVIQMLRDGDWGPLDVLVIDMPPGTGDAHITLAQQIPIAGAIIVSTPQEMALADARRGIDLYRRVGVPVLGVVENMSHFDCPNCGHRTPIFAEGGAAAEADRLEVPLIAQIPLAADLRAASDAGTPPAALPDHPQHQAFKALGERAAFLLDLVAKR